MRRMLVILLALVVLAIIPVTAGGSTDVTQQEAGMPQQLREWTWLDPVNRDGNVVYTTGTAQTLVGDAQLEIVITDFDFVKEPVTTQIYVTVEWSDDAQDWHTVAGARFTGTGGVVPPKPPGRMKVTIHDIENKYIRMSTYFDADDTSRRRYGVSGAVY